MTDLIRTALDWLRAVLYGPRTPGRHSRTAVPQEAPQAPSQPLAPDVWGARLVVARRHRAGRRTPPQDWFPPEPWQETGALVRPYVAALGEAPKGAQEARWGNAS